MRLRKVPVTDEHAFSPSHDRHWLERTHPDFGAPYVQHWCAHLREWTDDEPVHFETRDDAAYWLYQFLELPLPRRYKSPHFG